MKLTSSILTRGHRTSHSFCILHCAFCIVMSAMVTSAKADVTIADITARQRWPWNGLIDIDFTIGGAAAGEAFAIEIDATAENGAKALLAKTYASEPVAGTGANRIVWDLGADYPEFRANDLRISVTATPMSDATPVYMVIDLSGGPTATKYPVRYTTTPPAHVRGAADEPCQTTELWMKRIAPVSDAFTVNSYRVEENATTDIQKRSYWGKMTKDYYIGVFEVTQKQYQLVMGAWPQSWFTNSLNRASRPVEGLRFGTITGTWRDSQAEPSTITSSSFLGKIREKTHLPINLPLNIQLNYAARGGTRLTTTGETYWYSVNGESTTSARRPLLGRAKDNVESSSPQRDCDANSGTAYVGSYLPNDFGLYDTLGNVYEYTSELAYSGGSFPCREYYWELYGDTTIGNTKSNPIIDPPGIAYGHSLATANHVFRIARHGGWNEPTANFDLWTMQRKDSSYSDGSSSMGTVGFRLSMTCE